MTDSTASTEALDDTIQLPVLVTQPQSKWTTAQKVCIREFASEWNAEGADRTVILPKIVEALNTLEVCPSMEVETLKQV